MSKTLYSLNSLNKILKKKKPSQVCIVTSKSIERKLRWAISEINFPNKKVLLIPDGETIKDWGEIEKILTQFIGLNLDRKSIVVAMGGGTIGDAIGFACSIYLRGIGYINLPTTLLAQVDSSHGGKTAINFLNYKNIVGTFYPTIATVIDLRFLKTLKKEHIMDGLGEIIKAGFIKDPDILKLLRKETLESLIKSKKLKTIIKKSIAVKKFYETRDPFDRGLRQILNVGHTIGHAVELNNDLSHGRAVLIGMLKEFEICENLGLISPSVKSILIELLNNLGIILEKNAKINRAAILRDKKVTGNYLTLPVVEKVGTAKLLKINLSDILRNI